MHSPLETLPPPHPDARAHSERVTGHIRGIIEASGGAIPFSEYMDLALNAPGLGYYASGAQKFGRYGDFVTAPEISPLFSRCVARQLGEVLQSLGGGDVVEIGAGTGAMATAMLTELATMNVLPRRYCILERSAELRARQQQAIEHALPGLAGRVCWLDDLPSSVRGVVVANEVLDALPSARFCISERGAEELFVAWEDRFAWRALPPRDPALLDALQALQEQLGYVLPAGYVSEMSLLRPAWVRQLVDGLEEGVALLIDYGYTRAEYYHPQRSDGTLMCYYQHRAHGDPLVLTGIQDLSVAVDFSVVADTAEREGVQVAGFTTQAQFLLSSGLLELAARDAPPQSAGYAEVASQVKRLTLPGEMGDLVKVMALARRYSPTLSGFDGRDWRQRL